MEAPRGLLRVRLMKSFEVALSMNRTLPLLVVLGLMPSPSSTAGGVVPSPRAGREVAHRTLIGAFGLKAELMSRVVVDPHSRSYHAMHSL